MSRREDPLYLERDDLMVLFGYKNTKAFYNAINLGRFPVPTYKLGGKIVADREAVRLFFAEQRARGVRAVSELFCDEELEQPLRGRR
jgi:hypothetical protein